MKLSALKSLNRKVTLVTVGLLTLTALGGAAFATTSTTPDTSSTREITITALDGDPIAKTNVIGTNDGTAQDTTGETPLANITFEAQQIAPINGASAATMSATDPTTYTTTGLQPVTGTTNASGVAILTIGTGNVNDGYYLVTETTQVNGETEVQPFIVQVPLNGSGTTADGNWQYNVNVYPKINAQNDLSTDKLVSTSATPVNGTINDGTDYASYTSKQASVWAGQEVYWWLSTTFPDTMTLQNADGSTTYGTYSISDALIPALTYVDSSLSFYVGYQDQGNGNLTTPSTNTYSFSNLTPVSLVSGTDYNFINTDGQLTISLTNSGIDRVKSAIGSLPSAAKDGDSYAPVFVPTFGTIVSPNYMSEATDDTQDAVNGNDSNYYAIGNSFTPTIKNAYGVALTGSGIASNGGNTMAGANDPDGANVQNGEIVGAALSNVPQVYMGTINIKKLDAVSQQALSGATFALVSADNISAYNSAIASNQDGSSFYVQQDSTGALYQDAADVPSGVTTNSYTTTTANDGTAQFTGLAMNDSTSQSNAVGIAGTTTPYYLIETQAPAGYNQITTPISVNATIDGSETDTVTDNLDGSKINLPFTGSQGLLIMLIVAGVSGGSAIVIKRKKTAKETAKETAEK